MTSAGTNVAARVDDGRGGFDTQSFAVDVTNLPPGAVQGTVFNDLNGNGVQDTGEPPLAGWTVYLDLNHDGKLDPGDPTAITDASGQYAFSNVLPGTYTVAEVGQPGWTQTDPSSGTDTVTVQPVQVVSGIDFGDTQLNAPGIRPPSFVSTPPSQATVGQRYQYNPVVSNPDGQNLTFDLPFSPAGMVVNPVTGEVAWTPTADELGPQSAVLRLQDARGDVVLQDLHLTVAPADTGLFITSKPPQPAVVGVPYQYQVRAQDALGLNLQFSLNQPPDGMSIDPNTGLLTWTPSAGQIPIQHVTVVVTTAQGLSATQSFGLPVESNVPDTAPTITSTPPTQIGLGQTYLYQVQASDADGDRVSVPYLQQSPQGMSVDASGLVHWQPTAAQFGPNQVTLSVEDTHGTVTSQSFVVNVVTTNTVQPPAITSQPPGSATAGQVYQYDVQATDPQNNPLQFSLTQHPDGMAIDPATGQLRWVPKAGQVGPQTVAVQATDGQGASVTQTFTVTVHGVNLPPVITSTPPTQASVGQTYAYQVRPPTPTATR